ARRSSSGLSSGSESRDRANAGYIALARIGESSGNAHVRRAHDGAVGAAERERGVRLAGDGEAAFVDERVVARMFDAQAEGTPVGLLLERDAPAGDEHVAFDAIGKDTA